MQRQLLMQNLGQFWRKKFLVQFHCEILGDLIAILSGGMRFKHNKTRPTFPSNARVRQGNFYASKGKQNALERYFVKCKCDVTNYLEMPVERQIHIPVFWPIQQNLHISYLSEKQRSSNILQRLLLFHFATAKPTVFFPFSEITAW